MKRIDAEQHGQRKSALWRIVPAILVVLAAVVVAIAPLMDSKAPLTTPSIPTVRNDTQPVGALRANASTVATKVEDMPLPGISPRIPDPYDGAYKGVTSIGEKFQADARGRLVQNERTRLHIEALVTLLEPDKLYEIVEHEVRSLPREAAAHARELVERYKIYLQDQNNLVPPGKTPISDDEALAQLSALHDLRIAHFGEQTAEAMYGDEMKNLRELLRLQKNEN